MKIALISEKCIHGDISYNIGVIIKRIEAHRGFDLLLFSEAFLQGFDSLNFSYENDIKVAIKKNDCIFSSIKKAAKKYSLYCRHRLF